MPRGLHAQPAPHPAHPRSPSPCPARARGAPPRPSAYVSRTHRLASCRPSRAGEASLWRKRMHNSVQAPQRRARTAQCPAHPRVALPRPALTSRTHRLASCRPSRAGEASLWRKRMRKSVQAPQRRDRTRLNAEPERLSAPHFHAQPSPRPSAYVSDVSTCVMSTLSRGRSVIMAQADAQIRPSTSTPR